MKQEPETEQHAHAQEQQEQQEPDPESEPEPSSEREHLAVLPDNIENSFFNYCTDNACIICPVKKIYKYISFF